VERPIPELKLAKQIKDELFNCKVGIGIATFFFKLRQAVKFYYISPIGFFSIKYQKVYCGTVCNFSEDWRDK
jgi:hypothetical protein